ncbi:MAG: aminotransferase class I/II-fold pyridoxal phosphate-dependent enzyme [Bacillaceae bacterium]
MGKEIPLLDALKKHEAKNPISFHVPGHKYGQLWNETLKEYTSLLKLDVTELSGLDDLHDPSECIALAQNLATNFYKVKQTYFLVNGSTVGNLAMIMATIAEGDTVIVQRDCHKSVMNGLKLVGAKPIFIEPVYDCTTGLPLGLVESDVEEVINEVSDIKAIILTTPNYYGYVTNIEEIVQKAHKKGIPVLVDEAHGAHLALGQPFPKSAIEMGADVIVQSAHKTLPALTMASYLHFNSNIIRKETIETYLHMLQSSSPSYLLMLSLDVARAYIERLKKEDIEGIIASHDEFIKKIKQIEQIEVIESKYSSFFQDRLKIIIKSTCPYNGFQLQKAFEEVGIYSELADPHHVLFILPLAAIENIDEIIDKMKRAVSGLTKIEKPINKKLGLSKVMKIACSYKQLAKMDSKCIPLEEAEGLLSAEDIIPYPPGIPVLLNGERIQQDKLQYIQFLKEQGAKFQGSNLDTKGIKVYIEREQQ